MSKHLDIIRSTFPTQVYLTPKDIARVLYGPGRDSKKRVEDVRSQLNNGSLIPGLRKAPGAKRWLVKVVDLAKALDAEVNALPVLEYRTPPIQGRSRFKNPGPRLVR